MSQVKCNTECLGIGCKDCKRVRVDCTQCTKNTPYKLLKTGMVRGPSIICCRYAEVRKSQIRSHKNPDAKMCKSIDGWDANSLYLCCSGQELPCGKKSYVEVSNPHDPRVIRDLCDKVMADELFGFLQVDTQVVDGLLEKFSNFSPLFIIDSIPEDQTPQHMKDYQERTGRKNNYRN